MATVTKSLYDRMIADRPLKFDAEEVAYRESDGKEICATCIHFFTRSVDNHHTCEIYRPDSDTSVDSQYVCDFHSTDGEHFPLLTEGRASTRQDS
jgi:hypothetical protein